MKKIYALIIIIIPLITIAQNNFRWADSSAVWHHILNDMGMGYLKVTYPIDTIIQGQACQKIYLAKRIKYQLSPDSFYIAPLHSYDTYYLYKSNNSVFSYRNNSFQLAFKTNATVGEVWDLGESGWNSHLHSYAIVDSVYYQNYNGMQLRNIKIHSCDSNGDSIPFNMGSPDTLFISGIGMGYNAYHNIINEKFGPLYGFNIMNYAFPNNIMIDFSVSSLLCYESVTFPFYQVNPAIDCFNNIFTGIDKKESNYGFALSPNPFSQSTRISFDQTYSDIALEVYDIQGQRVAENHYADCSEITLQRNGLRQGMYFLKLTLDGKMIETRKMMIAD